MTKETLLYCEEGTAVDQGIAVFHDQLVALRRVRQIYRSSPRIQSLCHTWIRETLTRLRTLRQEDRALTVWFIPYYDKECQNP